MKDFKITHLSQNLFLHPYKSLYWQEYKILFFADIHLGKAAHFRKSGIPIPEKIHKPDLERIEILVNKYQPKRIIILGDLFHSSYNKAWLTFRFFCEEKIKLKPELVMGNHDILDHSQYNFLELHHAKLILEPFVLSHKPMELHELNGHYNLCGHIHPSVKLSGLAKQSLSVECFYFGKNHGILPAFGSFTGTSKLPNRCSDDKIFAVTKQKIIHLF